MAPVKSPLFDLPQKLHVCKTPLLLVLILLLGVFLRIYQIDRESFWLDEAFSYWMANSTTANIVRVRENNPPLYFLALHYWINLFGDSDVAIRLLSAFLGVLAIPVIFNIGRLLFNERFGLLAALFLAVSGFHIQYSQEARAYSLYFFLTSLSVYFTVLLYKNRTLYASIGYILSTALLLYSHDTAPFAYAAVILFYFVLAWPCRLSSVYPFFVANGIALLLYAPYIPVYLNHARSVGSGFWLGGLTVANILSAIQKLILFPEKIARLGPIQYGLIIVPICILGLALPALWKKQSGKLIAIALLFILPVGMNLLVSTTIRNIFVPRALISGLLPLPLFWATPVLMDREGVLSRRKNLALLATVSMCLISLTGSIDFLLHNAKEPWREAVDIFKKNYQQGDQVVYLFAYNEFGFRRYLPHDFDNLPVVAIPRRVSFFRHGGQTLHNEDSATIEALPAVTAPNQRLWLILRQESGNGVLTDAKSWLDANYVRCQEWNVGSPELASKLMSPLTLKIFVAADRGEQCS